MAPPEAVPAAGVVVHAAAVRSAAKVAARERRLNDFIMTPRAEG
jgi:hypothetical protein